MMVSSVNSAVWLDDLATPRRNPGVDTAGWRAVSERDQRDHLLACQVAVPEVSQMALGVAGALARPPKGGLDGALR